LFSLAFKATAERCRGTYIGQEPVQPMAYAGIRQGATHSKVNIKKTGLLKNM